MVIFSLKLLNSLRKAIAGRRFPHQLAGGVALGVLLGIIPHGNLLALFVLVGVLCFKVNHAMMGVIAILVSLGAMRLDDYSHQVGNYVLTHPDAQQIATAAWAMPVMPWTDLNNTVVMGSFLIGLASVLPVYFVTLPFFKWIAPVEEEAGKVSDGDRTEDASGNKASDARWAESATESPVTIQFRELGSEWPNNVESPNNLEGSAQGIGAPSDETPAEDSGSRHSVALFDQPHSSTQPPRFRDSDPQTTEAAADDTPDAVPGTISIDSVMADQSEFRPIDASDANASLTPADSIPTNQEMVSVETRIDVIRMTDFRNEDASAEGATTVDSNREPADSETDQPMDEALRYLLSQLRHSQQRKAAG